MSDEKNYPVETKKTDLPRLHDNGLHAGSLIEQSLSKLNQEQAQNLMMKAAEEKLRLEVKARHQNLDYQIGKKAAEDHVETFEMLGKSGASTRQSVKSEINTGAGKMSIESKSGATCFVASAAYNDPNHVDVIFLRGFRDRVLAKNSLGKRFTAWYWRTGPRLASVVAKSVCMQVVARRSIACVVSLLRVFWKRL